MERRWGLGHMNSDVGFAWMRKWCDVCYRDSNRCMICNKAMAGMDTPELVYNFDDVPICKKFIHKDEYVPKKKPNKDQTEIKF